MLLLRGRLLLVAVLAVSVGQSAWAEPRELKGHEKQVTALAFSLDGKTLVSAGLDGEIFFWDLAKGEARIHFAAHEGGVYAIALSPDGKVLASAGADHLIRLWHPVTGKEIRQLKGHEDKVAAVVFSPDGKVLASGSYDKIIRLWNTATWQYLQLHGHEKRVTAIAFSPDSKTLASGGAGETVLRFRNGGESRHGQAEHLHIWSLEKGKLIRKLPVRGSNVVYCDDGKTLVAGGSLLDIMPLANGGIGIDGLELISFIDVSTGEQVAVSNLNRNRWEGFSRRKPQPESESRGTRGGDR